MLILYLRSLSGKERNPTANFHLALFLAFIAGAINANGFFAVRKYTAHMTGIVTTMADSLVVGQSDLAISGLCALLFFVAGAACAALLIYRAGQLNLQSEFAFPFMIEAILLFLFGVLGDSLQAYKTFFMPITITVLCFMMGLQNATITKMSNSQIRTTHVTGLVTDLGIEVGRLFYERFTEPIRRQLAAPHNPTSQSILLSTFKKESITPSQIPDKPVISRLWLLISLLLMFFTGGIIGTLSFMYIGFTAMLPLGILLAITAVVPMLEDLGLLHPAQK